MSTEELFSRRVWNLPSSVKLCAYISESQYIQVKKQICSNFKDNLVFQEVLKSTVPVCPTFSSVMFCLNLSWRRWKSQLHFISFCRGFNFHYPPTPASSSYTQSWCSRMLKLNNSTLHLCIFPSCCKHQIMPIRYPLSNTPCKTPAPASRWHKSIILRCTWIRPTLLHRALPFPYITEPTPPFCSSLLQVTHCWLSLHTRASINSLIQPK